MYVYTYMYKYFSNIAAISSGDTRATERGTSARVSRDSSLVLFTTTLTSSCRARYRIKSTRASFIQILIPRGVTRIARSLRGKCGGG